MVPRNSKFNACNPWSKSLHITANLDQDHEGCGMSHAKSHMPKVPLKPWVFWKKRLAEWLEFEPANGFKSPSSTSSKCHMADSRIASFTRIHIFPSFFSCFSCGAIIALLTCKAYLMWHAKTTKNTILAHFVSHCSHKRFWDPKKSDFLPLLWLHLGGRENPWEAVSAKDPPIYNLLPQNQPHCSHSTILLFKCLADCLM